ncbi:MAG: hypothetical protein HQL32_17220, partial [Planctomycetes bacterium]|nr:hypothetical protein [Planctomycetota bacterium]
MQAASYDPKEVTVKLHGQLSFSDIVNAAETQLDISIIMPTSPDNQARQPYNHVISLMDLIDAVCSNYGRKGIPVDWRLEGDEKVVFFRKDRLVPKKKNPTPKTSSPKRSSYSPPPLLTVPPKPKEVLPQKPEWLEPLSDDGLPAMGSPQSLSSSQGKYQSSYSTGSQQSNSSSRPSHSSSHSAQQRSTSSSWPSQSQASSSRPSQNQALSSMPSQNSSSSSWQPSQPAKHNEPFRVTLPSSKGKQNSYSAPKREYQSLEDFSLTSSHENAEQGSTTLRITP